MRFGDLGTSPFLCVIDSVFLDTTRSQLVARFWLNWPPSGGYLRVRLGSNSFFLCAIRLPNTGPRFEGLFPSSLPDVSPTHRSEHPSPPHPSRKYQATHFKPTLTTTCLWWSWTNRNAPRDKSGQEFPETKDNAVFKCLRKLTDHCLPPYGCGIAFLEIGWR